MYQQQELEDFVNSFHKYYHNKIPSIPKMSKADEIIEHILCNGNIPYNIIGMGGFAKINVCTYKKMISKIRDIHKENVSSETRIRLLRDRIKELEQNQYQYSNHISMMNMVCAYLYIIDPITNIYDT